MQCWGKPLHCRVSCSSFVLASSKISAIPFLSCLWSLSVRNSFIEELFSTDLLLKVFGNSFCNLFVLISLSPCLTFSTLIQKLCHWRLQLNALHPAFIYSFLWVVELFLFIYFRPSTVDFLFAKNWCMKFLIEIFTVYPTTNSIGINSFVPRNSLNFL